MHRLLPIGLLLVATALPSASSGAPESRTTRIVFAGQAVTRESQIYSVEPTGRGLAQLTFEEQPAAAPLPSPDGRLVLFSRSGAIWVMRADGRAQRRLLVGASEPTWAPDSRRIAYVAGAGIRVIGSDGRHSRLLVRSRGDQVGHLAWSPDGRRLAFSRSGSVVILTSGVERRITPPQGYIHPIAWSPDGRWIACLWAPLNRPVQIVLVHPEGGRRRVVGVGNRAAWSPDGRLLAYVDAGVLRTLNVATGGRRALSRDLPVYSSMAPVWSPRGDEIAYLAPGNRPTLVTLSGRARPLTLPLPYRVAGESLAWTTVSNGLRLRPPLPLAVASAVELRLRTPVDQLAADGGNVAYRSCGTIGAWSRSEGTIVPIRAQRVLCDFDTDGYAVYGLALAGDRIAWGILGSGINQENWLTVRVLSGPAEMTVDLGDRQSDIRGAERAGDLVGNGDLLAFGTWLYCDDVSSSAACLDIPRERRPVVSQSLWRVREPSWPGMCPAGRELTPAPGPCRVLATEPGPLVPYDADAGRIAAGGDNALVLIHENGTRLLEVPVKAIGAQLSGTDLAVLVQGQLRHYDAGDGALVHTWPLPDVSSAGPCGRSSCQKPRLRLEDAARRLVVYVLDDKIHLLRLSDGADSVVADGTAARFGAAGLIYAYEAAYPWRGRIRFVPFDKLPLR